MFQSFGLTQPANITIAYRGLSGRGFVHSTTTTYNAGDWKTPRSNQPHRPGWRFR